MAYTDEEEKLMNDVLEKLHKYADEMEKGAEEEGKDFKSFLFKGDWFLNFCKEYKNTEKNGEDYTDNFPLAGLILGFIMNFDMWVNDSNIYPVYKKEWEKNDK
jgi:hypothetical protein